MQQLVFSLNFALYIPTNFTKQFYQILSPKINAILVVNSSLIVKKYLSIFLKKHHIKLNTHVIRFLWNESEK